MTTDPFTEAASAAAEEQWTREHTPGHPLSGPERMNRRIGFTMGAEWARTHLAAQEPTDAEVLAALNAQSRGLVGAHATQRDSLDRFESRSVTAMRAALSAARAARRNEEKR
ncbi:hypothetical protein [Pseudactinotalea sp.]|uniref:hypothetical protein n=1 Tax=Pseudactinotalea sp. TaxID=1926260 RepID=UPI003B3B5A2D